MKIVDTPVHGMKSRANTNRDHKTTRKVPLLRAARSHDLIEKLPVAWAKRRNLCLHRAKALPEQDFVHAIATCFIHKCATV